MAVAAIIFAVSKGVLIIIIRDKIGLGFRVRGYAYVPFQFRRGVIVYKSKPLHGSKPSKIINTQYPVPFTAVRCLRGP